MVIFGQKFTPFSVTLPVMLVAIGIADGIHILNLYHEYYEEGETRGQSHKGIIVRTMDDLWSPVVMTSLTTAAGFLSLGTSLITAQRSLGVFIAVGVLFAMVLSLTYIPAVLTLTRFRPSGTSVRPEARLLGNSLARLASTVHRWRLPILVLGVVVVILCAAGIPKIKVETIPSKFLGESNPVVKAMNVADRLFGGSNQLAIEVDTGRRNGLKDPEVLREMAEIQSRLERLGFVTHTVSIVDIVKEMNQKLHADNPSYYKIPDDPKLTSQILTLFLFQGGELGQLARPDFSSGEVIGFVPFRSTAELERMITQVQNSLADLPSEPRVEEVDVLRAFVSLFTKMPLSQALSLLTSAAAAAFIVMLLMQSLVAGLFCIIPLLLTVIVNFGFMAYSGIPLDMATLMVGSAAIGIGIDYAIHFVSRARLEVGKGRALIEAFQETMRTEGKAIVYNAVVVALGFLVLVASNFRGLVNVGILVALTMGISSVSAVVLIPAVIAVWRPKFVWRNGKPEISGKYERLKAIAKRKGGQ